MKMIPQNEMIKAVKGFLSEMPDNILYNTKIDLLVTIFEEETGVMIASESIFQAIRNQVVVERKRMQNNIIGSMQRESELDELRSALSKRSRFSMMGF